MGKAVGWIALAILLFYAYQTGWFASIMEYFSISADKARNEQVIYEDDGSITTVRYRSPLQMLFNGK